MVGWVGVVTLVALVRWCRAHLQLSSFGCYYSVVVYLVFKLYISMCFFCLFAVVGMLFTIFLNCIDVLSSFELGCFVWLFVHLLVSLLDCLFVV